MISDTEDDPYLWGSRRWHIIYAFALTLIFLLAWAGRDAVILSGWYGDDGTFLYLGREISSWRWLGPYNYLTLIKGIGFPLFLAILKALNQSFVFGSAAAYAAASLFFSVVISRVYRSRILFAVLVTCLLLLPPLAVADMTRVVRDWFYTSLTMVFFGTLFLLFTSRSAPRMPMILVAGVSGAWLWMTREEGIWLAPALAILIVSAFLLWRKVGLYRRVTVPSFAIFAVAISLVGCVGLINRAVYGTFVINEVKGAPFQNALSALERASYPYWKPKVPVPKEARAVIYDQVPSFAKLRPGLDPKAGLPRIDEFGCIYDKRICGDIGGGWFLWALRDAAVGYAGTGISPAAAEKFYNQLTSEIDAACAEKRLVCARWMPHLIPPMTREQIPAIFASAAHIGRLLLMLVPIGTADSLSILPDDNREATLDFLGHPPFKESNNSVVEVDAAGWYRANGKEWLKPLSGKGQATITLSRKDSPDLVEAFSDQNLTRQRFNLTALCPTQMTCPIDLQADDGSTLQLDVLPGGKAIKPGPQKVGSGMLYFDDVHLKEKPSPQIVANFWRRATAGLRPAFSLFVILGLLAFVYNASRAIWKRRITPIILVGATLAAAVVGRWIILTLPDALSFPITIYSYALPGIPLVVALAVISLFELIDRRVRY